MKRRTFIYSGLGIAAAAGIGLGIPVIRHFRRTQFESGDPLTTPDELGRFCDKDGLIKVGKQFLSEHPEEKSAAKLQHSLLDGADAAWQGSGHEEEKIDFLKNKIHAEFGRRESYILDGWVVSHTEARQCALLTLS